MRTNPEADEHGRQASLFSDGNSVDEGHWVNFYRDVFCCRVALREPDTALLLSPDGFQIYLHSTGPSRRPRLAPIGIQYLMWATDSQAELERVTTRLRARDQATYTYTENGVTFVEGCDPDRRRCNIRNVRYSLK